MPRVQAELIRGNLELRGGETGQARDELLAAAEWLLDRDRALAVRALMRAGEASYLAGDHQRYLAIARHAGALRRPDDPAATQLYVRVPRGHLGHLPRPARGGGGPAAAGALVCPLGAQSLGARVGERRQPDARRGRERPLPVRPGRGDRAARGANATVPHALEFLVNAEMWMGQYASVTANALEGFRLAKATGQHNSAGQHLAWLALMAAIQGDEETCRIRSKTAIELAGAHGLGLTSALSNWALAFLDLSSGRTASAANRLRATAWSGSGNGHLVVQVMATPHFVEAAVRTGDRERARAALDVLDPWVISTGSPGTALALAARCHALLAPVAEAAARCFEEALELHRRVRASSSWPGPQPVHRQRTAPQPPPRSRPRTPAQRPRDLRAVRCAPLGRPGPQRAARVRRGRTAQHRPARLGARPPSSTRSP